MASLLETPVRDLRAPQPNVWFITHTRQAFSAELVRQILARGDRVVCALSGMQAEMVVFGEGAERCHTVRMDMNDPVDVERGMAQAVEQFGRIDYLVTIATDGLAGAVEETSEEEIGSILMANLMAPLRVTRAALAHMRAQRSGRIIHVVPVSRTEGRAGYGLHNAARGALMALGESLAAEVRPFNISVSLIEPIPFSTDYAADSLRVARRMIDDYYDTAGRIRRKPEDAFRTVGSDPVSGVQAVLEAITAPEPPMRLIMGREAMERAVNCLDQRKANLLRWSEASMAAEPI